MNVRRFQNTASIVVPQFIVYLFHSRVIMLLTLFIYRVPQLFSGAIRN